MGGPMAEGDREASSWDVAVWEHAPELAVEESSDRVVVLDLRHLELPPYVFEGTAAQIWGCLDGDRTGAEVVADIAAAYEVPPALVEVDVRAFVARLDDLGLVVGTTRRGGPA